MEYNPVKIKSIDKITHDVLRIVTGKPAHYRFTPGQATEITINKDGWEEERRPFTFTSLPTNSYLEFTIKTYPERNGVTNELLKLKKNDVLVLHGVFGAIAYKGEGVFIAGGAGVTPFISIFRQLHASGKIGNNKLIFANKTRKDIILEKEFNYLLGDAFINILSDEHSKGYHHGMIDKHFLKANIPNLRQHFYLCGPPPMMDAVHQQLSALGIKESAITTEELELAK
ncbi:MAG: FAD-binding oxidoreductase [Saprospiraceae bacterium]